MSDDRASGLKPANYGDWWNTNTKDVAWYQEIHDAREPVHDTFLRLQKGWAIGQSAGLDPDPMQFRARLGWNSHTGSEAGGVRIPPVAVLRWPRRPNQLWRRLD